MNYAQKQAVARAMYNDQRIITIARRARGWRMDDLAFALRGKEQL